MVALTPIDLLIRAAEAFPDRAALIAAERRTSWRELAQDARRLASALAQSGVAPGDRVAVLLPNGRPLAVALWGIPMAGAIIAALNPRHDAAVLSAALAHSGARVLIADFEHAPSAAALGDAFGGTVVDASPGGGRDSVTFDAFTSGAAAGFAWRRPDSEQAPLMIVYQPGPAPRAITYTHRGAALGAPALILGWGMKRHAIALWTQPMTQAGGHSLPWALAAVGGTNLCLARVTPAGVFAALQAHVATHSFGSPALLQAVLAIARSARRSLRAPASFMTAAAPTPALVRDLAAINLRVAQSWGPPEAHAPALMTDWTSEWETTHDPGNPAIIAREAVPAPFLLPLALLAPNGPREVPADGQTEGEVTLSGDLMSPGYWDDPAATAAAFSPHGFRTGDLAVRHADGTIEFREREEGIVHVGGRDIAFATLTQTLARHPAVAQSVIEPGPEFGAVAFVELKPDASASEVELAAHCRTSLDLPADPCQVQLGPLPRTTTGRIARLKLRALVGD